MSAEDVLKKLLSRKIEKTPVQPRKPGKPGRPKVAREKKARNFTLCLAPQFVDFIDKMKVRDPKVKGRGRKVRFIIERFVEHEKRSLVHMRVLREALQNVHATIQTVGKDLSPKEKQKISSVVNQVHTVMKILGYQPKTLKKMVPAADWALISFCLDWKSNREMVF